MPPIFDKNIPRALGNLVVEWFVSPAERKNMCSSRELVGESIKYLKQLLWIIFMMTFWINRFLWMTQLWCDTCMVSVCHLEPNMRGGGRTITTKNDVRTVYNANPGEKKQRERINKTGEGEGWSIIIINPQIKTSFLCSIQYFLCFRKRRRGSKRSEENSGH